MVVVWGVPIPTLASNATTEVCAAQKQSGMHGGPLHNLECGADVSDLDDGEDA